MNNAINNKLFVRSLNYGTSKDTLISYFSQFGNVSHANIVLDPLNGRSRGFGFVTFERPDDAQRALDPAIEHQIDGKSVFASIARPSPYNSSRSMSPRPVSSLGGYGSSSNGTSYASSAYQSGTSEPSFMANRRFPPRSAHESQHQAPAEDVLDSEFLQKN